VQFSPLLKPIEWIDRIYGHLGSHAFAIKDRLVKEFDRAAPLDSLLGTQQELARLRNVLVLFAEGIDNNPYLSPVGRFLIRHMALNLLKNRRRVLVFYHANRQFIEANGSFRAPLIITGLPRSGSTLLQRLISEDPNTRSPYTFELEVPLPPMTRDINPLEDPRIAKSGSTINTISRLIPGFLEKFAESHLWSATEMEESLVYMLLHNGVIRLNGMSAGQKYRRESMRGKNIRPVFRYEYLFFKMLDAYRPVRSHWTLKAPLYAMFFPMVFEEYPDVKVVLTHRNPLVVLPSSSRLMESWCIAFDKDGSFDKHRFAELLELYIENCLMVPFAYRKEHPEKENQIFDCIYSELFADPIGMVKKIYKRFNLEYTVEFEERMKNYLENNQQGKYGRHRYSLEEYGLDPERYYQKYRDYMVQYSYGIPQKMERPKAMGTGISLG
jgi:hypothetical protein